MRRDCGPDDAWRVSGPRRPGVRPGTIGPCRSPARWFAPPTWRSRPIRRCGVRRGRGPTTSCARPSRSRRISRGSCTGSRVSLELDTASELELREVGARPGRRRREYWVAYVTGTVAGYFELVDEGDTGVEVRQFGIFPRLPAAAWAGTCCAMRWNVDARSAADACGCTPARPTTRTRWANYLARGLQAYREKEEHQDVETGAEPWPGAFGAGVIRPLLMCYH